MSYEDEVQDFLKSQERKPEDIFSMVTIMPKRKIKVVAHLEDKDGEAVLVSDIAENLVEFINSEMKTIESTPVNSQMFPMAASFMVSIVPRFIGIPVAGLMFEANAFRHGVLTFGLASMLLMQYIQQHELKIVTTTTELSDEEVDAYVERGREADRKLKEAFENAMGIDNEEPEDTQ